ncbi:cAMP-binding domain of CRP or a regulatory subunit of cAMP-dependent protein kinases [Allokutzneria albata]|uniref:cAMP-binding domain of CRP or a regulatory subunit of cAMP-dependent protein kinases n=1 Tax=Allokutzneria albata TaxID=211114 RepID=A0A1G9Y6M6_ALLAB|nr:cAMP-binding domain of CRP or a regulatory subunit of cAMP-dependent protein kinases [Allokutzneria albata]
MDHHAGPIASRGFRVLLGEQRWQALLAHGSLRTYRPGSFLLRQGDPGGFVLAVGRGRIAVVAGDANGTELLISLRGRGDLLGELAMGRNTVRSATARAIDQCIAHHVTAESFQAFLAEHAADAVLKDYLVSKLSETVPYHLHLVHFSPLRRVARLFTELVALADQDHPYRERIPLTQEAIAGALGLARSTVAEQIAVLRRDGTLTPQSRPAIADLDALRRHAGVLNLPQ